MEASLVNGFMVGMKVETPLRHTDIDRYWLATIISVYGPLLKLRYSHIYATKVKYRYFVIVYIWINLLAIVNIVNFPVDTTDIVKLLVIYLRWA